MTTETTTIIAAVTDLMFRSRLEGLGRTPGYDFVAADTSDAVREALAAGPAVAIIDLQADGIDWREAVAWAKGRGVPVLAFGRHTEADVLREAREAGCDRVVPRSTLVGELTQLVEGLVGAAG